MKKLRMILPLMLVTCVVLSCFAPAACALEDPVLKSADAVLVVDMSTGQILYEKEKDMHHSIASLTKIMTCLIAVEAVESGRASLTDMVEAMEDCRQGLDISSSNAGIEQGEIMSYQDLLYCALVHSANEACNVLAHYLAGSIPAFVEEMNARARELGCLDTHFVDCDGMLNRSEDHYSTPYDLYLITKEAMTHSLFVTICNTADYTVSATNKREAFDIHSSNALISEQGIYGEDFLYEGVVGVKTGFTKPAGYCLISTCKRGDVYVMCIVLGCNGALTYTRAEEYQNFVDSISIYDWVFKNFSTRTIFLADEPLKRVHVENAKDDATIALCPTEKLQLLLEKEIGDSEIVIDVQPFEGALVAPISKGQIVGTADVYIRGEKYTSIEVAADADVEMTGGARMKQGISNFFNSNVLKTSLIIIICLAFIVFGLYVYRRFLRQSAVRKKMADLERQRASRSLEGRRTNAFSADREPGPAGRQPREPARQAADPSAPTRVYTQDTAPGRNVPITRTAERPSGGNLARDYARYAYDSDENREAGNFVQASAGRTLRDPYSTGVRDTRPAPSAVSSFEPERNIQRAEARPAPQPVQEKKPEPSSASDMDIDEILRSFYEDM